MEHKDSTGNGGTIGPGDVQWMTAAGGILHEEYHSPDFASKGGPFRMAQLWVNLPARDKMAPAGYQGIADADIPAIPLPDNAGTLRIIAGEHAGHKGPAHTFTPINVWDMRLAASATLTLDLPEGHTTLLVVLSGDVTVNGVQPVRDAQMLLLDRAGSTVAINTAAEASVLVLTGEPLAEPIVGYGPFVMNAESEIREAIEDFNKGRFAQMA